MPQRKNRAETSRTKVFSDEIRPSKAKFLLGRQLVQW